MWVADVRHAGVLWGEAGITDTALQHLLIAKSSMASHHGNAERVEGQPHHEGQREVMQPGGWVVMGQRGGQVPRRVGGHSDTGINPQVPAKTDTGLRRATRTI